MDGLVDPLKSVNHLLAANESLRYMLNKGQSNFPGPT